ncbi:MAG: DUF1460 domain-containing protein [Candidatus Sumerlaeia bacterium]|nr:DUF1460 domain-containing protein [Candidatus Sumerlaeia bacterium]
MKSNKALILTSALGGVLLFASVGCGSKKTVVLDLTPEQKAYATEKGLKESELGTILGEPLFELTPRQNETFFQYLQTTEPSLTKRVVTLARKNIGQPYELYLLGEYPFEPYDPQPVVSLDKSDCVVFVEHTYAMSLADDWGSFFRYLQRIRYKDGAISVLTRNHYTEADWNPNNSWLLTDLSAELAGADTATYSQTVNRKNFFDKRYKLSTEIEKQTVEVQYVPLEVMERVAPQLQEGDMVNFVRTKKDGGKWVGHVGLVGVAPDGRRTIIHSAEPSVREEDMLKMVERSLDGREERLEDGKQVLVGFKFLRPTADPLAELRKIDGPDAPKISFP